LAEAEKEEVILSANATVGMRPWNNPITIKI
jgi:hypothetical protein